MNAIPTITVSASPEYLDEESTPSENEFVFRYAITLTNQSNQDVQLLTRHWIVKDSEEKCQEIRGKGVIGKQPHLKPGEIFQYSGFVVIETDVGTMQGSYHFTTADNQGFDVEVPVFMLANPKKLH